MVLGVLVGVAILTLPLVFGAGVRVGGTAVSVGEAGVKVWLALGAGRVLVGEGNVVGAGCVEVTGIGFSGALQELANSSTRMTR